MGRLSSAFYFVNFLHFLEVLEVAAAVLVAEEGQFALLLVVFVPLFDTVV